MRLLTWRRTGKRWSGWGCDCRFRLVSAHNFRRINYLDLLRSLYERILIPAEVHHEVTVAGGDLPGGREVRKADWIEVVRAWPPAAKSLELACEGLGGGERSSILLAKGLSADLVLLDEWKARRVAQSAGLTVMGCLGALEFGARKGLVSDLRSTYVDLLRQGIRFDLRLLQESLARFGLPKL